jgi:hypothetical protein
MIIQNNKAIIKNALSNENKKYIQDIYQGYNIPWSYNDGVLESKNPIDFQFVHTISKDGGDGQGPAWDAIIPILQILNPWSLLKAKSNLRTKSHVIEESQYHRDQWIPGSFTAIYHVNTCDGYTKWKDGDKIESIENTLIIFPAHMQHLGTTCTNTNRRIVININYIPPQTIIINDRVLEHNNKIANALYTKDDINYQKIWREQSV